MKELKPLDFEEFRKWRAKTNSDKIFSISQIEFIKQRIKSACEFYLKYKDNPELLIKEFPEELKVKEKEFGAEDELNNFLNNIQDKIKSFDGFGIEVYKKKYNEWLFKLAFKDVLKEEK